MNRLVPFHRNCLGSSQALIGSPVFRRRLRSFTITGMESEVVSLQDIFTFDKQGVSPEGRTLGSFVSSGIRPKFSERLKAVGFELPAEMFDQTARRWK